MSDAATIASSISLLPILEPICGSAIALNLAYLGLERFRYRKAIRDCARSEMQRLRPNNVDPPEKIKNNKHYKRVERLAFIDENGNGISDEELKNKRKALRSAGMAGGVWPKVYSIVFERQVDIYAAVVSALLAFLYLAGGVAHNAGIWKIIEPLFSEQLIELHFYLIAFANFLPVASVISGRGTVAWGRDYAKEEVTELESLMQEDAKQARVPAPMAAPKPTGPSVSAQAALRSLLPSRHI